MQKHVVTVRFFVIGGAIWVGVDCNKKHSKLNYNTDRLIVFKELVGTLNQVTISKARDVAKYLVEKLFFMFFDTYTWHIMI